VSATQPEPEQAPPREIRAWIGELLGERVRGIEPLLGGAGARRYWRLRFGRSPSLVLMHALPEDPKILPPALRRPAPDLPFLVVSELLERHGLPVPRRFGVHATQRWVLLEDLGRVHLCDLPRAEQPARRREALEWLARAHAIPRERSLPFERCFDFEWIRFELGLFLDELAPTLREQAGCALGDLAGRIESLPRVLCLRDFHSQNLLIDPLGRVRIIDYQDALLAPPELDLAAFLFDSYVEIGRDERRALLAHYARLHDQELDPTALAMLVVQRKCKDWSRFRQVSRRGAARYAPFVASARRALLEASAELPRDLAQLAPLLERGLPEEDG
jgi:hypothetical protein